MPSLPTPTPTISGTDPSPTTAASSGEAVLCTTTSSPHNFLAGPPPLPPTHQNISSSGLSEVTQSANSPPPSALKFSHYPSLKILKRVPRASRNLAAKKLSSILDDVVSTNNDPSWDRLFRFAPRCLHTPKRGGRNWNLTAIVNRNIRDEGDQILAEKPTLKHQPKKNAAHTLAARVASKLEEGDFKGARRLASSKDSIDPKVQPSLLLFKASTQRHIQPPASPPQISFPGLRPQYEKSKSGRLFTLFPRDQPGGQTV